MGEKTVPVEKHRSACACDDCLYKRPKDAVDKAGDLMLAAAMIAILTHRWWK